MIVVYMENRIRQHIEALFASAPNTARALDLREEMIVNVIERYHDLLSGGMNENEAYSAAVSGIGDVSELIAELRRDPLASGVGPLGTGAAQSVNGGAYNAGTGVGAGTGAAPKKGLSTGAIIAIVICSTLLLLALGGMIMGASVVRSLFSGDGFLSEVVDAASENITGGTITVGGSDAGFDNAYIDSGSYEVPVNGINELSIEWVNGDVEVTVDPSADKISFVERSSKTIDKDYALRYSVSNGKLEIRFCSTRTWKDIDFLHFDLDEIIMRKDLAVTLPSSLMTSAFKDIDITSVSGETFIQDTVSEEIEVESTSGDITLTNVSASEADLTNVSGNSKCEGCTFDSLDFETVSGATHVAGSIIKKELGVDGVSGDVKLELASLPNETGIHTVSGAVSLALAQGVGCTAEFSTVSGDFTAPRLSGSDGTYIIGNGGAKVTVDTVSGDFTVTQ